MAAQAGIVPGAAFLQACVAAFASIRAKSADTQLRTQTLADLREILLAWPHLSTDLRNVCLAVTRAAGTCRR
jgi:hypothetical protein